MSLSYKEMESPVGKLKLVASAKALVAVLWEQERPNRVRLGTLKLDQCHPILLETERQLSGIFRRRKNSVCGSSRATRQRISEKSLVGVEGNTVWQDPELPGFGQDHRLSQSV